MSTLTRRSTFAAFVAALLAPVAVRAQGATTGPAGGIPSNTAPSNSQGTPAGGTGVIGGTGATTTRPASPNTPLVGGVPGTSATPAAAPHRHRRRRRHHRRTTN